MLMLLQCSWSSLAFQEELHSPLHSVIILQAQQTAVSLLQSKTTA